MEWANIGINDIAQDHKGFLWLATWSGLAKYDGYNLKMYRQEPGSENGLQSNKISCVSEDSQQRLWVGTHYEGLYLYDPKKDGFISYHHDPVGLNSLSNNNVWAIQEDKDGFLWVGTENGLNRFDSATEQFLHYKQKPGDERSLSDDFIYALAESTDGEFWIGCEIGLNRVVRKKDGTPDYFLRYSLAPEGVSEDDFLRHNFIGSITPSLHEPGVLWIGTSIGLKKVYYSNDDKAEITYETYYHETNDENSLSHGFVTTVVEDWLHDRVWIGTYNGLNVLDKKSGEFQHYFSNSLDPRSLNNDKVEKLFLDRSGELWIGTNGGTNHLNLRGEPFRSIRVGENKNEINSIVTCMTPANTRSGTWVGTNGGGVNYLSFDSAGNLSTEVQHFPLRPPLVTDLADFISDIKVDGSNNMWIATQGAGLMKIQESDIPEESSVLTQFSHFTKENGLADDYLMTLSKSSANRIWFGYWDEGIGFYDPTKETFAHFTHTRDMEADLREFPAVHLIETIENGNTFLWLGTREGGVFKLKYDSLSNELDLIKHYFYDIDDATSLSNDAISCFFQKSNNELLIGTENGLNILDLSDHSFTHILEKDGLENAVIQSIQQDETGKFWIGTRKGLSSIPSSLDTREIKNYNVYNGLEGNLLDDESSSATPSGQLIFGGANGVNYFHPLAVLVDTVPPEVIITDFRLFNQSIPIGRLEDGRTLLENAVSETTNIELSYRDNVLAFEFVGLQFVEPQKIKYAYKLEGFQEDWVYTNADQRIAHYTNLPYDDFVFKVKAANSDGVWSEPVAIGLTVLPPVWLTTWAYIVYGLLFMVLLYGISRLAQTRAKLNHNLELETLEREKLEEVNHMKSIFFTNISHELRTPLTLIISPLEQYLKDYQGNRTLYKSFDRMYHNANRLLTMINQILDIKKSEAGLMKLKVAEGNFVQFAQEIGLSFKELAKQHEIKLTFSPEKERIPLWYDRDQMEKLFFNLLTNAIKFTPSKGNIDVIIKEVTQKELSAMHPRGNVAYADYLLVEVHDTGVGIPQDQLALVFDRFYQVEKNQAVTRQGGTGIGLALSKSIVEAHHGIIWVKSEEDQGASFFVALPREAHHFAEDEKIIGFKNSENISHYRKGAWVEKAVAISAEVAAPAPANPALAVEKKSILIVEDNRDIRAYLRENLSALFVIHEAGDGVEGVEKANKHLPDLILADIAMPKMDGIEMCRLIKSTIDTSHIPVILLTARTSLIFKIDGLETGADDYITKPFNMQLLLARINNIIDSRQRLKERFTKTFDLSPTDLVLNSLDETLLTQVKVVIESHIDDSEFSVEQLATSLLMSRMQLYRKMKAITGKSPKKIILGFRLQRAAQLLQSKQYTVAEVTYMVGYNDLKSFRNQFKKEFGVSPGAYEDASVTDEKLDSEL